jgi:hypothetical protein
VVQMTLHCARLDSFIRMVEPVESGAVIPFFHNFPGIADNGVSCPPVLLGEQAHIAKNSFSYESLLGVLDYA